MIIGLTGGIGTGKSTVAAMLVQCGAALVDADQVAREVVEPGEPALAQLTAVFGTSILDAQGHLDRKALGAMVFADQAKRLQLEAIVHPVIRTRMQARLKAYKEAEPERLAVADIPLLFETGQAHMYEGVLVVYVPRQVQLERLMKREQMTEAQANARIALQLDIEKKREQATWVIDNSGSLEETAAQVKRFYREIGQA